MLENIIQQMNVININAPTTINVNKGGINYELNKEIKLDDTFNNNPIYLMYFKIIAAAKSDSWKSTPLNIDVSDKTIIDFNGVYHGPTGIIALLGFYRASSAWATSYIAVTNIVQLYEIHYPDWLHSADIYLKLYYIKNID